MNSSSYFCVTQSEVNIKEKQNIGHQGEAVRNQTYLFQVHFPKNMITSTFNTSKTEYESCPKMFRLICFFLKYQN